MNVRLSFSPGVCACFLFVCKHNGLTNELNDIASGLIVHVSHKCVWARCYHCYYNCICSECIHFKCDEMHPVNWYSFLIYLDTTCPKPIYVLINSDANTTAYQLHAVRSTKTLFNTLAVIMFWHDLRDAIRARHYLCENCSSAGIVRKHVRRAFVHSHTCTRVYRIHKSHMCSTCAHMAGSWHGACERVFYYKDRDRGV